MKMIKSTIPALAIAAGLVLAGCPGDDSPITDGTTTDDTTSTTAPTTTPTTTPTTNEDTTVGSSTDTTATDTTTTTTDEDPFVFNDTPPGDYTQVDRMGFPAVNTGLNLLGDKDEYNAATPVDDANLMFVTNILDSLNTLHLGAPGMQTVDNTGLDDDLLTLGLQPCNAPQLPMDNCDDQGGPFAIPDVITIDLDTETGFPNGRQLDAPVMDIILAVLLLDLGPGGHPITQLVDFDQDGTPGPSLNPLANDVPFEAGFPYVAAPH